MSYVEVDYLNIYSLGDHLRLHHVDSVLVVLADGHLRHVGHGHTLGCRIFLYFLAQACFTTRTWHKVGKGIRVSGAV